jgi:hypothetical protein
MAALRLDMRKLYPVIAISATLVIALLALNVFSAFAGTQQQQTKNDDNDNDSRMFHAILVGFSETPTQFSNGSGTFTAKLSPDGKSLTFTLTYHGLPNAFMAHIHFGKAGIAGGIVVWLCGAQSKQNPTCPQPGGTVTGTITASDVLGLNPGTMHQAFPAGNLTALIVAIRNGAAYVNVHTLLLPAGEIRGQIQVGDQQ